MNVTKSMTKVFVCTAIEQRRQECIKESKEKIEGVKEFCYLENNNGVKKNIKSKIVNKVKIKTKIIILLLN